MTETGTHSLAVGWLDPGATTGDFAESLARLAAYETAKARFVQPLRFRAGPMLDRYRNLLVARFMDTPAEWLLMIDSDMVFGYDYAERLIRTAADNIDRHEVGYAELCPPIVGGLCFGVNETVGQFPTLYRRLPGDLPEVIADYPQDTVVEVDATGAAFLLVHRYTISVMMQGRSEVEVFDRRYATNGMPLGEDISFCFTARDLGIPILVDTSVKVGHIKPTIVDHRTYARPGNSQPLEVVR